MHNFLNASGNETRYSKFHGGHRVALELLFFHLKSVDFVAFMKTYASLLVNYVCNIIGIVG